MWLRVWQLSVGVVVVVVCGEKPRVTDRDVVACGLSVGVGVVVVCGENPRLTDRDVVASVACQ